ncbi:hypothetical protein PHYBLDRAFT_175332 [Phycomyces blakesleeanus NRRL 1555(-)]|uniref:Uncharacterized protein n=1 Tax=Phycomyces blakesleeanus (strain ATCC 8743b / DSM 1359 / FGSC 10004 / NBRC 33097 / NRRL 1555) TaxID=763407 RepID=A0A167JLZ1_PHYB8|nr:hypothetical protein PHYBLDRAFT_175332 [Phycomyces blakesleeanus NRRL 1555(-)]OAD66277.1 hypothetical protein PHYBLDRAFT_175332 [Phycomyces blakesleeanus NRRL 1555(-)]|eukprot:XP_018284317.1 hypothetical protein PHYBLDRAFT_175332 [Phycomyces blakesleeanus NRRL 1555(-)]
MSVSSPPYQQQNNTHQTSSYEYLSELVSKRSATIKYLCRAHEGNTHWFNTILLTQQDLGAMYPNHKMMRRTSNFYTLGVSLGTILDITHPLDYLKALTQLLSEFDFYTNDHSKQKMANDDNGAEGTEYTHLIVPHVVCRRMPYELDYFETFFTLCDIMTEAYEKLLVNTDNSVCSQSYFELVLKCDAKFKKIVSLVTKELDALARNAIKEELKLIDPLSHSNKIPPIDFEGTEV